MISFPNSKINLGLRIVSKRSDGYHNLETVFYPVPVCDVLEILEYRHRVRSSSIPFSTSGLAVEGDISNNLCLKAYKLLKKKFTKLPHIRMHLHKVIPAGAGLGGGSSDAAFTLRLVNQMFGLGLNAEQLIACAIELGSDCPFFIYNQACHATGRGEVLEKINVDLKGYCLLIVYPGIHINTGRAFLQIKPSRPEQPVKEIVSGPITSWKKQLINDFEVAAFTEYPQLEKIKDHLYAQGAVYASMSGSGSTIFGIFEKKVQPQTGFPKEYFVRKVDL
ncbi:MAG TPA: 4-(cytidine 5'-diphospho)-2-C-methyl-D-erythritol kinase [Chitinophagaceae bacterium]|nr:4-(cytidine 5'-diphospho)-2-C-methyl-D-erythritol kinase [Chitinophagaceae bacterium]